MRVAPRSGDLMAAYSVLPALVGRHFRPVGHSSGPAVTARSERRARKVGDLRYGGPVSMAVVGLR